MRKKKTSGLSRDDLLNRAADRLKRIDSAIAAVNRDLEELNGPYLVDTQCTGPSKYDVKRLLLGQEIN